MLADCPFLRPPHSFACWTLLISRKDSKPLPCFGHFALRSPISQHRALKRSFSITTSSLRLCLRTVYSCAHRAFTRCCFNFLIFLSLSSFSIQNMATFDSFSAQAAFSASHSEFNATFSSLRLCRKQRPLADHPLLPDLVPRSIPITFLLLWSLQGQQTALFGPSSTSRPIGLKFSRCLR